MNWIILIIAGLFEVLFTTCLGKARDATGNAAYWWYAGFTISIIASMTLLIKVLQNMPIGTVYVVWTGIGAVGTVLAGIILFKEPVTLWRIFFITTLIGSVIGLKLVSH